MRKIEWISAVAYMVVCISQLTLLVAENVGLFIIPISAAICLGSMMVGVAIGQKMTLSKITNREES